MHFENSPVPHTSPEAGQTNSFVKQELASAVVSPIQNQSKQVLPEKQSAQTSLSIDTTLPQSPVSEKPRQEEQVEELLPRGGDSEESVSSNLLEVQDRKSAEDPRVYSDMSSLSESAYDGEMFEDKVSRIIHYFWSACKF